MATTEATEQRQVLGDSSLLGDSGLQAWRRFVATSSKLIRELDEELRREEGFALGDYDVLAQLSRAPKEGLRMCDLAGAVLLSPSGLSRRVERLERAGLIHRDRSSDDARSIEARLTAAGRRKMSRLRASHLSAVKERFGDRLSDRELKKLRDLLGKLDPPPGT